MIIWSQKGIIVRNRNKITLCENCLRITVGTPEENKALIVRIKKSNVIELYKKSPIHRPGRNSRSRTSCRLSNWIVLKN